MENLASMGVDDVPWFMEKRAQVLEEVALDPEGCGPAIGETREINERIRPAVADQDRQAVVDDLRAGFREWWPDFAERQLLSDLYRRAARRESKSGTKDSRRRPDHPEGVRVAEALLADVKGKSHVDPADESNDVTVTLLGVWLSQPEQGKNRLLEDYIQRSVDKRAYFDAVFFIFDFLVDEYADIPRPLAAWSDEFSDGRRSRPSLAPLDPYRPVNSANLVRDVQIQFVILVLSGLGVAPWGTHVSGCRIVAEALEISEDTVGRIWKERMWVSPFEPMFWKYVNAVSERTGFSPYVEE